MWNPLKFHHIVSQTIKLKSNKQILNKDQLRMEYIYHFAHIGLETWEKEPIKVIIGVEIWFLVCLLIAWGIASWRLKVKRTKETS